MCPPISCCRQRLTRPLPTQVYYLTRLLLALSSAELLPHQLTLAEARLGSIWDQLQHAVQHRYQVSATCALALTERLAAQLLQADCCRRSLLRQVPLGEALGPARVLA
ncbi:hypothetical protein [Hymenobacter negativus]|uniref:Secreted protein n=1 Tax=Hymenobacter negativus TaxID=2795026 RepID=A0ABS3QFW9_9BACT|nr:hypothetical protein [Hymenobacter negativus]MBO2009595.1 hypothetical protein [Hymenobacter negativus]